MYKGSLPSKKTNWGMIEPIDNWGQQEKDPETERQNRAGLAAGNFAFALVVVLVLCTLALIVLKIFRWWQ